MVKVTIKALQEILDSPDGVYKVATFKDGSLRVIKIKKDKISIGKKSLTIEDLEKLSETRLVELLPNGKVKIGENKPLTFRQNIGGEYYN